MVGKEDLPLPPLPPPTLLLPTPGEEEEEVVATPAPAAEEAVPGPPLLAAAAPLEPTFNPSLMAWANLAPPLIPPLRGLAKSVMLVANSTASAALSSTARVGE